MTISVWLLINLLIRYHQERRPTYCMRRILTFVRSSSSVSSGLGYYIASLLVALNRLCSGDGGGPTTRGGEHPIPGGEGASFRSHTL